MSLEPTQFTRESAERIANVVRAAELASPAARPLSFEPLFDARKQKVFRVNIELATYSTGGDVWEKGFFGVVHDQRLEDNGALTPLYNDNGTPKTQYVLNLFSTLPPNYDAVRVCAYTKIGNVNVLIAAEC